MNTNILQKCIDELNKPEPNFGYLRGLLEAMMDMQEVNVPSNAVRVSIPVNKTQATTNKSDMSEGEILNSEAKARLNNVDMSAIKHG